MSMPNDHSSKKLDKFKGIILNTDGSADRKH